MRKMIGSILKRLRVKDERFIEIESKRRVLPEELRGLQQFLVGTRNVHHEGEKIFFDQFLDTPSMDIFRLGASCRIRYKGNGSKIYLQYKGPGFHRQGVLYRSEFSTGKLRNVLLEESHHDIVHFTDTSIRKIFAEHVPSDMLEAMRKHLGEKVIRRISRGPIISLYKKDKFVVDLGSAFLEPSLDRVYSFHIAKTGIHPLSTFCEYENEVKSTANSLADKMEHIEDMLLFDRKLIHRFDMPLEPLDKYHRCASFFFPGGRRRPHKSIR
jgi:hypothetical protein